MAAPVRKVKKRRDIKNIEKGQAHIHPATTQLLQLQI